MFVKFFVEHSTICLIGIPAYIWIAYSAPLELVLEHTWAILWKKNVAHISGTFWASQKQFTFQQLNKYLFMDLLDRQRQAVWMKCSRLVLLPWWAMEAIWMLRKIKNQKNKKTKNNNNNKKTLLNLPNVASSWCFICRAPSRVIKWVC